MSHHDMSGACQKCQDVRDAYPGFARNLWDWFSALQAAHPEVHISCFGRGRVDQQACFERGASRARWLQSAHNFNAAIDTFVLLDGDATWPTSWYDSVMAPAVAGTEFTWYGQPGSSFFELPHVQVTEWRELVKDGRLVAVEGDSNAS